MWKREWVPDSPVCPCYGLSAATLLAACDGPMVLTGVAVMGIQKHYGFLGIWISSFAAFCFCHQECHTSGRPPPTGTFPLQEVSSVPKAPLLGVSNSPPGEGEVTSGGQKFFDAKAAAASRLPSKPPSWPTSSARPLGLFRTPVILPTGVPQCSAAFGPPSCPLPSQHLCLAAAWIRPCRASR